MENIILIGVAVILLGFIALVTWWSIKIEGKIVQRELEELNRTPERSDDP